jgi:hypothetical protein
MEIANEVLLKARPQVGTGSTRSNSSGAPMAPFLTQFLSQGKPDNRTSADMSDLYEAATELVPGQQHIYVATL